MRFRLKKWNEEIMAPEEFLQLSEEAKKDIIKATPYVKPLGTVAVDDKSFAGIRIIWNHPRYKFKL